MINKKLLFEDKAILNLKTRGFIFNKFFFENFYAKIKSIKTKIYNEQYKFNSISLLINILKRKKISFNYFINFNINLKVNIIVKKKKLSFLDDIFNNYLLRIPNFIDKSVFYGLSDCDNVEIRIYKKEIHIKNLINDFESDNFYIDFLSSSKISGSGFVLLKDKIAQLNRALINYMLDLHIFEHGYTEITAPLMVNTKSMFNSGHLPKFINDQFKIEDADLWLIPTSEVVLANIFANRLIKFDDLPLKFVSKTECFRKEKGSYGAKVKGLLRQHQFDKVELFNIVLPSNSYIFLEEMLFHAEKVLQNLNLGYRIISLCSNDLGFASAKTYDIEAWFPKRKMYVEVSSCSNTETFQSFRMNAKIKNTKFYPHFLNGSGLAIGRILLCIIENYSDENGNIFIPDVLIRYMNGLRVINF